LIAGGIVGIGAINQIPSRAKAVYEDAFEHFLGEKYETKFENREQDLNEGGGNEIENYITGLFDSIDLGDDYQEGPQSYTFERVEWADEDAMGGEEAEMFVPAHEYIESKGTINLTDPNGIPLVFTTNGEDIVVNFNTENFPGQTKIT
jgi:hypothetical protein